MSSILEAAKEFQLKQVRAIIKDGLRGGRTSTKHGHWPLVSDAAGVHPDQVEMARERVKKAGLTGVDFTPSGDCVFATRGQRAKALKLFGFHDRNGGYGD